MENVHGPVKLAWRSGAGISRAAAVVAATLWMSVLARPCAAQQETRRLTLDTCIRTALERNLAVRATQLETEISHWNVRREWAEFEPAINASARTEANDRQNTIEQTLSQASEFFSERNDIYDLALQGKLMSGAEYRLGYSLSDRANNLTNITHISAFEDQFQSFAGLTLSQPVLRGGGLFAPMAGIRLARAQKEVVLQDFRRRLMAVAAQTQTVYWDLRLAQELVENRRESVRVAEKILEDNRERVKAGKMSDLEVLMATAGRARRVIREQEAQRSLHDAANRLKALLSEAANSTSPPVAAVDEPDLATGPLDLDEGMKQAMMYQPDYLRSVAEAKQEGIRLRFAENQRWPKVDLVASYGFNGLGDSVTTSWEDIRNGDFETWYVGIQASVGLGGDWKTKSELAAARLRKEQALLNVANVEVEICNAMDSRIRDVRMLREKFDQYAVVVDYSRKLLETELAKLDAGTSDSRQVLEVEEELFNARDASSTSRNEFLKARVEWELATGTILMSRGLDILPQESGAVAKDKAVAVPSHPVGPASPAPPPSDLHRPMRAR